ncbi:hypothetical protein SAMN04487766_108107 [Actinomyces ruminicola]|uniref:Uncharacterized protein n=1 Tax=Actinomyces ruminicola TaxID=332524 RepID=A0A1G9WZ48_9ACTO|nr:hypothetical protein SAMN04487766_108107 [Actinomyces ruminicola]
MVPDSGVAPGGGLSAWRPATGACSRARRHKVSEIGTNSSGAAGRRGQSVGIMRFLDRPQGLPAAFVPNSDTPAGAWAHTHPTHHTTPATLTMPPPPHHTHKPEEP